MAVNVLTTTTTKYPIKVLVKTLSIRIFFKIRVSEYFDKKEHIG